MIKPWGATPHPARDENLKPWGLPHTLQGTLSLDSLVLPHESAAKMGQGLKALVGVLGAKPPRSL